LIFFNTILDKKFTITFLIKKYIDKNNMNLNNIFYVPSKYVLHIYITIYFT